jgi:hypothetical protein
MELKTYNWENFKRNKIRYIIFAIVFIWIMFLSILKQNFVWVVLLCVVLGSYFWYSLISNQIITLKIQKNGIKIWEREFPRNSFKWYTVEIDPKTEMIKNLVLITQKWHNIYTLKEHWEKAKNFFIELDENLEILGEYNQTFLDKLWRVLKL